MLKVVAVILIMYVCAALFALAVCGVIKITRRLINYCKVRLSKGILMPSVVWHLDQEYDKRGGRVMIWRPEFVDYDGDERFLLHNSDLSDRVAGIYKSWMIPAEKDYRKVRLSYKEVH